jgi:hypothetical protein
VQSSQELDPLEAASVECVSVGKGAITQTGGSDTLGGIPISQKKEKVKNGMKWKTKRGKRKAKKAKLAAPEESEEEVAPCEVVVSCKEFDWPPTTNKGKESSVQAPTAVVEEPFIPKDPETSPCEESVLSKELTPSRESGSEDAVLVVRPLGPDVGQRVCPFRTQHILDGNGWKSCTRCRALIRQLAYEKDLDTESVVDA